MSSARPTAFPSQSITLAAFSPFPASLPALLACCSHRGDWNSTELKSPTGLFSPVLPFPLSFPSSFPAILCIPLAFLTSAEHGADVSKAPSAMTPEPLSRANLNPLIVPALDFLLTWNFSSYFLCPHTWYCQILLQLFFVAVSTFAHLE